MKEEKHFTAEEISSMILFKMKEIASTYVGRPVKKAVVTVPAFFNNSQRQATKDAATIAGLHVIQILNEPTAAALAYGLDNKDDCRGGEKLILVFDLGGGTFDVSLLQLDGHGVIEVKATSGDTHLGGQDFDNRMVDHLLKTYQEKHNEDLSKNHRCVRRMKAACEKAKRVLSIQPVTTIDIESFHEGEDFTATFTQAKFVDLNKDLFEKCMVPVKQCLQDANVEKNSIDEVVLVGGSTRIPKIQEMLQRFFDGKELYKSINVDEAVACGAAIQAAILNGDKKDPEAPKLALLDVTPLSLGIEDSEDKTMCVIIPRNTRIPCTMEHVYLTSSDNQTGARFRILEVGGMMSADKNLLGEFLVSGLRPEPKGIIKFRITFSMDVNGILTVTARNEDSKQIKGMTISRDKFALSQDEIDRMIREARIYELQDMERKAAPRKITEEDRRPSEAEDEPKKLLSEVPSEQKQGGVKAEDEELALRRAVPPYMRNEDAIGIDLGTSYSCVGDVSNAHAEITQDEHNSRTIHSPLRRSIPTNTIFDETISSSYGPHSNKAEEEEWTEVAEQSGDEGGSSPPVLVQLACRSTKLFGGVFSRSLRKGNERSAAGGPSREKGGDERRPPKKEDGERHAIVGGGGRLKEKAQEDDGPVIGIDFGTTYSRVGVVQSGRVVIIEDEGNRSMPSYVAFERHDRRIGEVAATRAIFNPTNTIFAAKRLLGRRFSEEIIRGDTKLWPFEVVAGEDDQPLIVVRHKGEVNHFCAEEISSMIISKMKDAAEIFLRQPVSKAVITVPAYFNDAQRQATKDACAIAGLKIMYLLNDSSAAALAYSHLNEGVCRDGIRRLILIFHLGGGTCDVSLVELDGKGALKVKAAAGDTHLGGEDFDNRLMNHIIDLITRKHKNVIGGRERITADHIQMRRLKEECEKAKKSLSSSAATTVFIEKILPGIDLYEPICRAKFEELNFDLFQRCFNLLQQCLDDAKVDKDIIDDVVLVGGSTSIPKIKEMLREFLRGKAPCSSINATESVAYGAALQAAMLVEGTSQLSSKLVLVDVTRLSLGIETAGGDVIVVVPRNTRVPCMVEKAVEKAYIYPGYVMSASVYEGEKGLAGENDIICRFELQGMDPKQRGNVTILVTFDIDEEGLLTVSARIIADKRRLPRTEMDRMIKDAERYRLEDQLNKKAVETKYEFENLVCSINSKLGDSHVLQKLHVDEKLQLESTNSEASQWLYEDDDPPSAAKLSEMQNRRDKLEGVWNPIKERLGL